MPGRDRSGPAGMGPMTGRGAGNCGGRVGRSNGRGGRRQGQRRQYHATGLTGWQRAFANVMPSTEGWFTSSKSTPSPPQTDSEELAAIKEQVEMLQRQSESMEEQLKQIQKRVEQSHGGL